MLWLLAALGWTHAKMVSFDQKNSQYALRSGYLPGKLRVNPQEESFAFQDQTHVRLPYGGNPDFNRNVADVTLIDTDEYRESYQINQHDLRVKTEYRLLDDAFFSPKNNFSTFHMVEADIQKIDDYWQKRRAERAG